MQTGDRRAVRRRWGTRGDWSGREGALWRCGRTETRTEEEERYGVRRPLSRRVLSRSEDQTLFLTVNPSNTSKINVWSGRRSSTTGGRPPSDGPHGSRSTSVSHGLLNPLRPPLWNRVPTVEGDTVSGPRPRRTHWYTHPCEGTTSTSPRCTVAGGPRDYTSPILVRGPSVSPDRTSERRTFARHTSLSII